MDGQDSDERLRSWHTRYFEGPEYEAFNGSHTDPQVTREQVTRSIHWLRLRRGQRVLDLCCGAARHTSELADRGFHAFGVDRSVYQLSCGLERLRRVRGQAALVRADVGVLPFADESFDGAICLFNSFGYGTDAENARVLLEAARVLKPGGRLIFDSINRDAFLLHTGRRIWDPIENGVVLQEIQFLERTSQIRTEWKFLLDDGTLRNETTFNRLYSAHELISLCEAAGLEVVDLGDGEVRGFFSWSDSKFIAVTAAKMLDPKPQDRSEAVLVPGEEEMNDGEHRLNREQSE